MAARRGAMIAKALSVMELATRILFAFGWPGRPPRCRPGPLGYQGRSPWLVCWAFRLRFGHQQYAVERGPKAFDRLDIASKMSDDDSVIDRMAGCVRAKEPVGVQSDLCAPIQESVEREHFRNRQTDRLRFDSGKAASNARDCLNRAWLVGFVGHDGLPWVWEDSKQCWLPVTELSRRRRKTTRGMANLTGAISTK